MLIRCLALLMTLGWPFCVWLSITHPEYRWLLPVLVLVFVARLITLRGKKHVFNVTASLLAATGAALSLASFLLRDSHFLLWYPVVVNIVMLVLFGSSLRSEMSMVERFARLREPELPARAIAYTYRVTQLWCLFFIFNGSIAALTCVVGNVHWWTLWNGIISYVLIGMLMGGEWIVRQRLRAQA